MTFFSPLLTSPPAAGSRSCPSPPYRPVLTWPPLSVGERSGRYEVMPTGSNLITVYCDMDTAGGGSAPLTKPPHTTKTTLPLGRPVRPPRDSPAARHPPCCRPLPSTWCSTPPRPYRPVLTWRAPSGRSWTLCGKYDRDNSAGATALPAGFGRADVSTAFVSTGTGLPIDGSVPYASIDCRPFLGGGTLHVPSLTSSLTPSTTSSTSTLDRPHAIAPLATPGAETTGHILSVGTDGGADSVSSVTGPVPAGAASPRKLPASSPQSPRILAASSPHLPSPSPSLTFSPPPPVAAGAATTGLFDTAAACDGTASSVSSVGALFEKRQETALGLTREWCASSRYTRGDTWHALLTSLS